MAAHVAAPLLHPTPQRPCRPLPPPLRPCPIGLSVAQVVRVEGRTLTLAGADIVDGSPVLDIKPFVPFCDNVPAAAAPAWVAAQVGWGLRVGCAVHKKGGAAVLGPAGCVQ